MLLYFASPYQLQVGGLFIMSSIFWSILGGDFEPLIIFNSAIIYRSMRDGSTAKILDRRHRSHHECGGFGALARFARGGCHLRVSWGVHISFPEEDATLRAKVPKGRAKTPPWIPTHVRLLYFRNIRVFYFGSYLRILGGILCHIRVMGSYYNDIRVYKLFSRLQRSV